MWTRVFNIFSAGWNAWRFSANPMQFVISLLMIILAPYLIYLFWGTIIALIILAGMIGWLLYRFFKKRQPT